MASFDWKKKIEDSIREGSITTITTTRIFYAVNAANVKLVGKGSNTPCAFVMQKIHGKT